MSSNGASRWQVVATVLGAVAALATAGIGVLAYLDGRSEKSTETVAGVWTGLETRDNSQLRLEITQVGQGSDYDIVQHDSSATLSCGGVPLQFAGTGTFSARTQILTVSYSFACPGDPATPLPDHYRFDPGGGTLTDDQGVVFRRA